MDNDNDIDRGMKTEYFDCICSSAEHTLRFCYFKPNKESKFRDDAELYAEVHLNQYRSFWTRVWVAIKYVFGYECQYGHWDVWTLDRKDCERLRDLVDKMIEWKKAQEAK